MAPGDVCHGPRCSLAGLGPVASEYRSCHWPGGSAGSPQCVRPMGCWFFSVPRPPHVCAVSWAAWLLFTGVPARFAVLRLRCPEPPGSCSPVCSLGVLCCVCGVLGHLAPVHRCARCVRCVCALGGCVPLPPHLIFVFSFDRKKRKTGARVHCCCGGAIVLGPLGCVVGAVAAVAPQVGVGCGCGLWLRCSLGRPGQESRVSGFGVWLVFDLCFGFGSVRRLRR